MEQQRRWVWGWHVGRVVMWVGGGVRVLLPGGGGGGGGEGGGGGGE
eukprot:SAG25_NODE_3375_length_1106_cov_1.788481_1_plen_45_part_10